MSKANAEPVDVCQSTPKVMVAAYSPRRHRRRKEKQRAMNPLRDDTRAFRRRDRHESRLNLEETPRRAGHAEIYR